MGNEITSLYNESFEDLGCTVSRELSSYGTFVTIYNQVKGTIE